MVAQHTAQGVSHLLEELAQHPLRPLLSNDGGLDCGSDEGRPAGRVSGGSAAWQHATAAECAITRMVIAPASSSAHSSNSRMRSALTGVADVGAVQQQVEQQLALLRRVKQAGQAIAAGHPTALVIGAPQFWE